uniref:Sodium/potassium-transporting ATPase subunit beta-3 n=1 Tax=Globodera rostochiensis TaxID=31243 RepID=A0A914GUD0_GLORO
MRMVGERWRDKNERLRPLNGKANQEKHELKASKRQGLRGRIMTKADNGKFIEENNTLMANGRAKPAEKTSLSTFIYNRQDGTFLGRSAKSWAQIVGFYIIFYICLAAFWIACLAIFLATIDESVPRYYGENTIIGANPGVGYHPWLESNPESTLIKFNEKDKSTYEKYIKAIDGFLDKYNNSDGTRSCIGKESNSDHVKDGKAQIKNESCLFDCGFLNDNGCGETNDYGFKDGKPCIILSLNRLIGWAPENFNTSEIPAVIKSRYKKGSIAFNCEGISDPDKELAGNIKYIPPYGIEGRYYPYAKMLNYHQPFAVVKFSNLPLNRVVLVKCSAYAKNIKQDEESKAGMVTFELLRQQKEG